MTSLMHRRDSSVDIILTIHRGFTHSLYFLLPSIAVTGAMIAIGCQSPDIGFRTKTGKTEDGVDLDHMRNLEEGVSGISDVSDSDRDGHSDPEMSLKHCHGPPQWHQSVFGSIPDTIRRCCRSVHFWNGCFISMLVHALVDIVWMKGVKIWWPLDDREVFSEVNTLGLFHFDSYGEWAQRAIMSIDTMSEAFFYVIILLGTRSLYSAARTRSEKSDTDSGIQGHGCASALHIFKFFKYLAIVQCVAVGIIYLVLPMDTVSIEAFIISLFVFGYVFISFSLLAPFIFIDAVQEWCIVYFMRSLQHECLSLKRTVMATTRKLSPHSAAAVAAAAGDTTSIK